MDFKNVLKFVIVKFACRKYLPLYTAALYGRELDFIEVVRKIAVYLIVYVV